MAGTIKILETFRDAIQGLEMIVPTHTKVEIINSLLMVGFDYLDVGSFVSSRLIPQFHDMDKVMENIGQGQSNTKLFALVANEQGAKRASLVESLDVVGFPFSTSETFLKRNINADFTSAWKSVNEIQNECIRTGKEFMVYLAMAFGNPYNDPVGADICLAWAEKFHSLGIKNIHLSDIIGVATPPQIGKYYELLSRNLTDVEFGIHLHIHEEDWYPKVYAAYHNGCQIFDGVISGLGGCPMTGYEMLSNLPSSHLIDFARINNIHIQPDKEEFEFSKKTTL